jgi:hypothetical protein
MTRDHNSKQRWQPYIANPHYIETEEHKLEVKIEVFVYRVLRILSSVPRRFWARVTRKKH